jgi:hypothetical protein
MVAMGEESISFKQTTWRWNQETHRPKLPESSLALKLRGFQHFKGEDFQVILREASS